MGFLLPLLPTMAMAFFGHPGKIFSYAFKGFGIYAGVLVIFGTISYGANYDQDYFILLPFIKRFLRLLVLYPLCRSIFYIATNEQKKTVLSITVYFYLLLAIIIITALSHYFGLLTDIFLTIPFGGIERKMIVRYCGILQEPSYTPIVGMSLLLLLSYTNKSKIRLSGVLAILLASLGAKAFSSLVLVFATLGLVYFKDIKLNIDTKASMSVVVLSFLAFGFIDIQTKTSTWAYYIARADKISRGKDLSFNDRTSVTIKNFKNKTRNTEILFGTGLGQEHIKTINVAPLGMAKEFGYIITGLFYLIFMMRKSLGEFLAFSSLVLIYSGHWSLPLVVAICGPLGTRKRGRLKEVFHSLFNTLRSSRYFPSK